MIINIISPHASYYLGGMEVVTLQMARHLAKRGVTVRFFTKKSHQKSDIYTHLQSEKIPGLQFVEVTLPDSCPVADGSWPIFYEISCLFGSAAQPLYRTYADADMFIAHLSVDAVFVPRSSKTILHLHGAPGTIDPLMSAAVKLPITTIAHSASIQRWWSETFPDLSPIVFQNGVDVNYFHGSTNSSRDIDVLYVGRFLPHKGVDDVLRAVKPEHRVVIAGNGPDLARIRSIIRERNLEQTVTVYDTPSTEKIADLYRRAKIFVCPSRGREGVLTTLLEAGASGCAVLTTSGAGMTDIITNHVNGFVVEPANITELGRAIDELLADDRLRLELANTLQSTIADHWSWGQKASELEVIYRANR